MQIPTHGSDMLMMQTSTLTRFTCNIITSILFTVYMQAFIELLGPKPAPLLPPAADAPPAPPPPPAAPAGDDAAMADAAAEPSAGAGEPSADAADGAPGAADSAGGLLLRPVLVH